MESNINTNTNAVTMDAMEAMEAHDNTNTNTSTMEARIVTVQESAINGRRATLYKVESPIAPIYVVQYEGKNKELETEVFNHTNKDKANKRYMAALKSMLKD